MHARLQERTDSHLSHPETFQCRVMLSYYVFHEFAKVTGKANVKELVMAQMWWKEPYVQNMTSFLDLFCPEFWAPSGTASGLPCFLGYSTLTKLCLTSKLCLTTKLWTKREMGGLPYCHFTDYHRYIQYISEMDDGMNNLLSGLLSLHFDHFCWGLIKNPKKI